MCIMMAKDQCWRKVCGTKVHASMYSDQLSEQLAKERKARKTKEQKGEVIKAFGRQVSMSSNSGEWASNCHHKTR
jgi:hypothetical protein